MRLVADHDDVVAPRIRIVRVHLLVEFLHQAEHVALVLAQQGFQVRAASRAGVVALSHHAAAHVGLVDLAVQVIAVGDDHEGVVAAHSPVHLAGEEQHRIALAAALRVPEHAKPALVLRAVAHGTDGAVHAQELVVARHDLDGSLAHVVEQDEVLEQVQEIALVADTL